MKPIISIEALEPFRWQTQDPFLFCVHHDDQYPAGNDEYGPQGTLDGRDLGQDFAGKDGFRMYHGLQVPGFPHHPHRGFETVTIVRNGLVDHADSLGAAARYGHGDVQWLTAGRGILHSEMFPLVRKDQPNPTELFQIWLNLPRANKLSDPHFTMLWSEQIPRIEAPGVTVTVVAGKLGEAKPLAPPPKSWASDPRSDVAIWTLRLAPGARWTLPAASAGLNRSLYVFRGESLKIAGNEVRGASHIVLQSDAEAAIENGAAETELLLLQGRPIAEPVVQYGPFVMNSEPEIVSTIREYQRTQFGGWPWPSDHPVHGAEGRFARHADGKIDRPA
jgi:redox-sensitive bicupin YhaK (pirin superfamily)